MLKTEVIDYAVAKIDEALSAKYATLDAELACLRQRKQELDLELKRLTDSIAQGEQSQSIMNAIGEREKKLRTITDKLLEPAPGSLRAKLEELREFAVSRLSKIRELLARPENIQEAHEALAERVGQLQECSLRRSPALLGRGCESTSRDWCPETYGNYRGCNSLIPKGRNSLVETAQKQMILTRAARLVWEPTKC